MKKARMEERTCMHPLEWEPWYCQEAKPTFWGKRQTPRNRGRHRGRPKPKQPRLAARTQTSVQTHGPLSTLSAHYHILGRALT